jgi:hypothetical protein
MGSIFYNKENIFLRSPNEKKYYCFVWGAIS